MESTQELKEFGNRFSKVFGSADEVEKAIETVKESCRLGSLDAERYIRHNLAVANQVLSLGLDRNAVIAALVHNVIEHGMTPQEVEERFGHDIFEIVDNKTRFERALSIKQGEKGEAEKKLMIVLTTNPQVVMVQLGEVLDKMRNLDGVPDGEREEFVVEVKDAYAPLCHKLGIYSLSSELKDLAFLHEEPRVYAKIQASVKKLLEKNPGGIDKWKTRIAEALSNAGIKVELFGRLKTVYSVYAKMKRKNVDIDGIYDLVAYRAITDSVKECYEALGVLHSMWKPVPGEFDDYIAKPKPNGYRSLHTSMLTEEGFPVEVQIRTKEMNDFAEFGIASHWRYKGEKKEGKYDRRIEWIKQVLDWERTTGESTRMDIFGKEVFAMTPKGQVIELPEGASVVDFAYAVHSEIGNRCGGARINGAMASLNTKIKNGDVVEIITSDKHKPKMSWLSFTRTGKAKQKIMSRLGMKPGKRNTGKLVSGHAVTTASDKIRLAKCCSPLPGDEIVGVKTTKRKISVHRIDCKEVNKQGETMVNVEWADKTSEYDTELAVETQDRIGILKDILGVFSKDRIYVSSTNAKASQSNTTTCTFSARLRNIKQLEEVMKKIGEVKGVTRVYRSHSRS